MSEMPWVRFFPSDWLGGTRAMSASETGIYITLIATMYERGEPIPVDHTRMARLCGASNSVFKACLKALIDDGKIIETENGLWNDRVQKEVVYRQEKSQVGFQAANARWDKKRNEINAIGNATAMPPQSERNANQKPDPDPDTIYKDNTPLPPKGADKRKEDEEWFDEAVRYDYPRKTPRLPALKAWMRLSAADKAKCARAVTEYSIRFDDIVAKSKRSRDEELQYVPHLSTFINQRRWEEIDETA